MKDRKKLLILCCACLILACIAFFALRAFLPQGEGDTPMEEEDLLAYLAEQRKDSAGDETEDLQWDPAPDSE